MTTTGPRCAPSTERSSLAAAAKALTYSHYLASGKRRSTAPMRIVLLSTVRKSSATMLAMNILGTAARRHHLYDQGQPAGGGPGVRLQPDRRHRDARPHRRLGRLGYCRVSSSTACRTSTRTSPTGTRPASRTWPACSSSTSRLASRHVPRHEHALHMFGSASAFDQPLSFDTCPASRIWATCTCTCLGGVSREPRLVQRHDHGRRSCSGCVLRVP